MKEIEPSLWRPFQDQSYYIITQYVDQSVVIRQSVTRQVEPYYILCNVSTGVFTSQASQVATFCRVSPPASVASGSHIWIIMTEAPMSLS